MGKTPKKAAPEGDERNRYVRRLKNSSTATTTTSSSKHENMISADLITPRSSEQHENENTNRGKPMNVQKNLKATSSKSFKSKLRSPVVKSSITRLPKSSTKSVSAEREVVKSGISSKVLKNKPPTIMYPKSEESESQTVENVYEDNIEDIDKVMRSKKCDTIVSSVTDGNRKENESEPETGNIEKQPEFQEIEGEITVPESDKNGPSSAGKEVKINLINEAVSESLERGISKEETEEHEVKLNLMVEDSPLKASLKQELESPEELPEIQDKMQQEEPLCEPQKENGHVANEKDDQSEDLADTESCSVDVVESTTSEMSEASDLAQMESEKAKELPPQQTNDDISFVSFDASIVLKDVHVRLNDCLKDNSHLYDLTTGESSMSEPACKDSSFGRTLRNISGRHSINRMRHVTVRNRLTPNNSLYVNMSTVSVPDEESRDHKILRHRTGLSETFTCNGTPSERKRKLEPEVCSEAKKVKTDSASSLFNTSIGILQGLRRPIQVSTPNVNAYKFKPEKLDISGIVTNDEKVVQEQSGAAKKWCSIM
ncbi:uncharacterized protein LOC105693165 isoform X1 [Athalia rosae]|uniref:uncharacterized protein LOC105693165 isoform X1 n=2 Tax=Athalia rosae TaxID=37344 RepID=UPI0020348539|nr:uncharacterized protein LOC105693165 isoform X1 [Athalia rosae]XP_020712098.2 uncharacterized protein LOC105693165 isoform X1 [Athalia rosae]